MNVLCGHVFDGLCCQRYRGHHGDHAAVVDDERRLVRSALDASTPIDPGSRREPGSDLCTGPVHKFDSEAVSDHNYLCHHAPTAECEGWAQQSDGSDG